MSALSRYRAMSRVPLRGDHGECDAADGESSALRGDTTAFPPGNEKSESEREMALVIGVSRRAVR
jgi:hypothetical protein